MSTLVRLATLDDAADIAGIQVRAWRAAYRGLMPDSLLDELSIEGRVERWSQWIAAPATPEHRMWVLEHEGAPAGFASTGPSRDDDAPPATMEIYALYLEPDRVGRGLGATLFSHALQDLARRGAPAVTLWALDGNARAARFYERMGMRQGGEKVVTIGEAPLRHLRYRLDVVP